MKLRASTNVLVLLCVMYFITYVDRVNVSTAAAGFGGEFHLSKTQIGFVFSAFAYPYLIFQIIGGWIGDRFGARRTLALCSLVWAGATILSGFATGLLTLVATRVLLGLGEGATFPTATRAMASWMPPDKRGFAQGITHACARVGNAATPPIVVQLMLLSGWRGSFIALGILSLIWVVGWFWYMRDDPARHPAITPEELQQLPKYGQVRDLPPIPWGPLVRRMAPVTLVYFCYGWILWLFLSWIPQYFLHNYQLDLKHSAWFASTVFIAGVIGDTLGGLVSDAVLRRTGSLKVARRNLVVLGMVGALISLLALLFVHTVELSALFLSLGFFFAEFTIGPMWAIPMDIAPKFSGTASGLMNTGSALAAIVSPVIAGFVIDRTGNWDLPFAGSVVLMAIGAVASFTMHPERGFVEAGSAEGTAPSAAAPL